MAGEGSNPTYGSVNRLVPIEGTALVEAVVRLAKGHAGQTVRHQAEIQWVEAPEEGREPGLSTGRRARVDDLAGLGQDLVEALRPVLDVAVVDRTVALLRGGHYEYAVCLLVCIIKKN